MTTLRNTERLSGVHPTLAAIVRKAFLSLNMSIVIIEGVRTKKEQEDRYALGRTKPGKIVTNSLKSLHLVQKDGYGHAVDLAPCNEKGIIDWTDLAKFEAIRLAMFKAAKELGVRNLRSGADWDKDNIPDYKELQSYIKEFGHRPLVDYPHYELTLL